MKICRRNTWNWACKLEADRLLNLKLDDDTFQPERQVVISERKLRSVDSPFGLVEEQLFATAYTQHPYGWPVVGWDQDLHRMTLDDCLAYYRSHYHPGKITVVIAGDVEPERARDLVDRYFGQIPAPAAAPEPKVAEPPQRGERRAILKKVSQVEALFAGFHVVGLDHPDLYPLNLLAVILSGGKASRFHQEFVRVGKAIALDVELAPLPFSAQDPDLLVIAAVAAPGQSLPELEQELWAALNRLPQEGVTPAELARAKKLLRSQAVRSLAHNFFRGLLVGLFHLKTGDAQLANQILSSLEAVTADDILRVARTYLREDNRTVVVLKRILQADYIPEIHQATLANGMTILGVELARGPLAESHPSWANAAPETDPLGKTRGWPTSRAELLTPGQRLPQPGSCNWPRTSRPEERDRSTAGPVLTPPSSPSLEGLSEDFSEHLATLAEVVQTPSFPEPEFRPIRERRRRAVS